MLDRALRSCWLVSDDPEFWIPIIKALRIGATDRDDPRGAARCAAVLQRLRDQNIDILKHLDKTDRMDDGKPTETIAQVEYHMEFDRRG